MPIKAPLSWLKEYVDITVSPEELARRLTLAGIEVEHIVKIGREWEETYTGLVTHLERHPNADRLNLATVEYGEGKSITVVTGAPNIREGDKVVIALVDAPYWDQHQTPPKWMRLKPAKIRGIQTEGMVMSEAELGLSEEHEGIIVLDPSTPVGLPARDVLGETIFEIEVTPNNGRILSMVGLAREIAALTGGEVRYPSSDRVTAGPPANELLAVEIQDTDLCQRYSGAVIQGVRIEPSPDWMQRRLTLAGMRPVNNIVDITNYVMLEMGQPLHAFSYDAVRGHKIIVRRAHPGEHIVTLDHEDRTLDGQMLAICDVERPVAVAGVMGGEDSEISEQSNNVLLESAHFEPRSVRRTARLMKLPSEASYRFERWVDPNLTVPAMKRAADLMRELAGGVIAQGYVDAYPRPIEPRRIHFYTDEVERLLGIKVPPTQIAGMLRRLGFTVDIPPNADAVGQYLTMLIDVPTYRNDVTLPADLVEEVARMVGYDTIPETLLNGGLPPQEVNASWQFDDNLRDIMVALGMDEVICYSVAYSGALERLRNAEGGTRSDEESRPVYRVWDTSRPLVTVINPISSRQDVMRPTLLPNMLDALRLNLRLLPETPIRIFELGHIYLTRTEKEVEQRLVEMGEERARYPRLDAWQPVEGEERLPLEPRRLMGLLCGPRQPRSRFNPESESPVEQMDFFDAKGVVEAMLRQLGLTDVEWTAADAQVFHPGRVASISANGQVLGVVGEIHPALVEEWEIPAQRVCCWDVDVEALSRALPGRVIYQQVSPYQPVRQDMAFVVGAEVPAVQVARAIRKVGGSNVTEVELFDIYTGKPIPEGQKSLAFAVTFSAPDKLLTEDDIAKLRKRIESVLERELGAKLRS